MSEIMKIVDERETRKKTETGKNKVEQSYSERVGAKWFSSAFNIDFLQLTCKFSLNFKSNLELTLSITLKERELYESKHFAVECICLKIWDLLSLWYVPQS